MVQKPTSPVPDLRIDFFSEPAASSELDGSQQVTASLAKSGNNNTSCGAINVTANPMDATVCAQPRATIVVQQVCYFSDLYIDSCAFSSCSKLYKFSRSQIFKKFWNIFSFAWKTINHLSDRWKSWNIYLTPIRSSILSCEIAKSKKSIFNWLFTLAGRILEEKKFSAFGSHCAY